MDLIQLGANTYVLQTTSNVGFYVYNNNKLCLIDSGSSEADTKKIMKIIEDNNWLLTTIINTHSHADHIFGNKELQDKYHCNIYASDIEIPFINFPIMTSTSFYGGNPFSELKNPFIMAKSSRATNINNLIIPGLSIIDLSGHSPGLIGILTSDDVSIHYLINNQDNIKEIMYNSYFLTYFIRSGDLQRIERVDSDLIYGKFLILILNKDIKVLEAVHDYIFSFCKNYLDNEEGASLETSPLQKYSSIFIQKFILILSQSGSNTIPITIALKCLIYLAALSHNNQVDILIDDVITQLVKNLSSFDQNLIYYSLLLIYRFSKHNSESILLLQKYPEIIIKMLNIIKGSKIPESRYHPLIICKVLEIIFNFLNNAQIRNFLLNFTNRKFIKYLFRLIAKKETYTVNNQNYYIKIISLCYGILAEIVSKNVDIRQYIALNYNFFSVMNIKSLEYLEILNYYKIFAKEDNGNTKKELTTFFEHLFHFLVRYVSNDLNQINSAKFKCRNLYSLFYYIKRCQEIQMAPSIIKEVTSLYSRELITNTHLL